MQYIARPFLKRVNLAEIQRKVNAALCGREQLRGQIVTGCGSEQVKLLIINGQFGLINLARGAECWKTLQTSYG
jgi:hypothetical protein